MHILVWNRKKAMENRQNNVSISLCFFSHFYMAHGTILGWCWNLLRNPVDFAFFLILVLGRAFWFEWNTSCHKVPIMSINTRADDVFMVKEKSQRRIKQTKIEKTGKVGHHTIDNKIEKAMLRLKPRVTYDDDNIFSGSQCNNALWSCGKVSSWSLILWLLFT